MTENSLARPAEKRCSSCKQFFPATIEYWHRDSTQTDGLKSACKQCRLSRQSEYDSDHRSEAVVRSKEWAEKNPDKAHKNKAAYVGRHHNEILAYHAAYRADNPDKIEARYLVKVAIRHGELPQVKTMSCADCGDQAANYHHPDYSKPLEVIPLCALCHAKRHT